jgi:RNA 2',3'-cyclic 3'-phosphodiesterase
VRIFLAVFPPVEVQRAVFTAAEALKRPGDGVSWVKRENLHYTLRFLGELGEDGVRRVTLAADEAVRGGAAFDAALGSLGAFPDARRARVLWAGMIEGGERLTALAQALEAALRRKGFDRADHPFTAHLTIGRVRDPRADWTETLAAVEVESRASRFTVDRISVVESKLSPKGSTYTVVHEALLAPAPT